MIPFTDWFSWMTSNYHPRFHIFCHNATGKDYSPFTNRYTRHNHSVGKDEYIITDCYLFTFSFKLRVIQVVTQSVNLRIVSNAHVISYHYPTPVIKIATEIDSGILSNIQLTDMKEFATSVD